MKIIIVGGGTAGWLTAFGLSHDRKNHEYTVIDSSKIGIIGVGESTTGAFSNFAKNRGISKLELIQGTNALPKYGIKFFGWRKDNTDFISPVDGSYSSENSIDWALYTSIVKEDSLSKNSLGATLIKENKTDYYIDKNNNISELYGHFPLHIDTFATGTFFKNKSMANNVTHIDTTVKEVILDPKTGFIEHLILENNEKIYGDLFIDCSGFSQILIKKLNPEWDDYSNFLPVNTAIPFNVVNDTRKKSLYTSAKAMSAGWIWEIPTQKHTNQGYIFSDKFLDEDKAVEEIKNYYKSDIEYIKTIKFKAGKLKKSWIKNCVAVGLSSAFLEPLQATSIHCTVAQIEDLSNNVLGHSDESTFIDHSIDLYNKRISNLYSSMADLISLHYSGGNDNTKFWKYINNNRTDKVKAILNLASLRGTRKFDFETEYAHAGQAIWNHSIAGLGYFNKDVIKKLFEEYNINFYQASLELEKLYKHHMLNIDKCLTIDELNNILKKHNV